MTPKVYIPHGSTHYASWVGERVPNMEKADIVMFTGGTDIASSLYHEKPHPLNDVPDKVRDAFEVQVFLEAYHQKKKLLGVCRGAQFLCVMAGGKLVQNQPNTGNHHMTPIVMGRKLKDIPITSSHHQAQYPWPIENFKILGYTFKNCTFHHNGDMKEMLNGTRYGLDTVDLPEVEDVFYPNINALAIQGHPEWLNPKTNPNEQETIDHYKNLLKLFMEDKL